VSGVSYLGVCRTLSRGQEVVNQPL
jgi:hypothetical protein